MPTQAFRPDERTTQCLSDLCEECAAGFLPLPDEEAIVHYATAEMNSLLTPGKKDYKLCKASVIWKRLFKEENVQRTRKVQDKSRPDGF